MTDSDVADDVEDVAAALCDVGFSPSCGKKKLRPTVVLECGVAEDEDVDDEETEDGEADDDEEEEEQADEEEDSAAADTSDIRGLLPCTPILPRCAVGVR